MNNMGILVFHQGWGDIFNCLALINYYCKLYDKIILIIREDSKELINFYTNNLLNIYIIFISLDSFDNLSCFSNIKNTDFIGIGYHDSYRNDKYKCKFRFIDECFVKGFYIPYDIPYMIRIDNFEFDRDYTLEDKTYQTFINKYGNNYILYHEVIETDEKDKPLVNLNRLTNIFFDYIKVLENACEIHLLDSSWGIFIYLLDCKYKIFNNKKIVFYEKRGYYRMFEEPIKLNNWIIK